MMFGNFLIATKCHRDVQEVQDEDSSPLLTPESEPEEIQNLKIGDILKSSMLSPN